MPKIDSELIATLRQIIPDSKNKFRINIEKKHFISVFTVFSMGVVLALFLLWNGRAQEVIDTPSISTENIIKSTDGSIVINGKNEKDAILIIDVAGKVITPGVYELPQGSRVIDAIKVAGGVRKNGDSSGVNLARLLEDGEQIYIDGVNSSRQTNSKLSSRGGASSGKINLNRATIAELDGLPGVGPVLAARIIEWRSKNGSFKSVDELRRVSGIGDVKFSELKGFVSV